MFIVYSVSVPQAVKYFGSVPFYQVNISITTILKRKVKRKKEIFTFETYVIICEKKNIEMIKIPTCIAIIE